MIPPRAEYKKTIRRSRSGSRAYPWKGMKLEGRLPTMMMKIKLKT